MLFVLYKFILSFELAKKKDIKYRRPIFKKKKNHHLTTLYRGLHRSEKCGHFVGWFANRFPYGILIMCGKPRVPNFTRRSYWVYAALNSILHHYTKIERDICILREIAVAPIFHKNSYYTFLMIWYRAVRSKAPPPPPVHHLHDYTTKYNVYFFYLV